MTTEEHRAWMREYKRKQMANPDTRAKVNTRRRALDVIKRQDPVLRLARNTYNREFYATHPESRQRIIERTKINGRKYRTGVTDEQFQAQLSNQEGHCALCDITEPLHADHDHDTMKFRGILCGNHNRGIGLLGDTIEGLEAALAYLIAARDNQSIT